MIAAPYDPGHVARPEPGAAGRTVEPGALLIGGRWREARGGHTRAVVGPADGAVVSRVPRAGTDDLDAAVRAARAAFDEGPWPRLPGRERAQILYDAADLIERETAELARRQSLETGKPLRFGLRDDGPFAAMAMRYFAALASQAPSTDRRAAVPAAAYALREPHGVVAALTAFHHPVAMGAAILAPALASGGTVVYKPSETAPLSALKFAELCVTAGVPEGVLNVITGPGPQLGTGLAEHPGVDMVAFAGGAVAGRAVATACGRGLLPTDLDVGAPNAHVVFADACLEYAARSAAAAVLPGRGEFRAAGTRILVHRPVYRAFTEELADRVRAFAPGDPLDPDVLLGPVARRDHAERLAGYLARARADGARLVAGGAVDGLHHRATVLAVADPEIAARLPEVFAPLALVLPFDDPGEAVALANAGPGPLTCAVYTTDVKSAHGVVGAVRATACRISTCSLADADESADVWPLREFGAAGMEPYTRPKAVWVDSSL
jgi:acyl-CoA reductase-like NAD-dependent aldehyde dehydrogenase